jgi:hypothetical protein
VGFIEDDDAFLAELGRDVLGDFRIEEVVEGEDDNVEVWQLSVGLALRRQVADFETYHASNSEVRTDPLLLSIPLDVVQGVYTSRDQVARFIVVQFLFRSASAYTTGKVRELTSWKLHKGTLPGSARPFSHANAEVRSRQRESTILPFFSLLT